MWHYANYHGKELLVVGHSVRHNNCILVELDKLPMNEAVALRQIAHSRAGQEQERLVPVLEKVVAPDRINNWFSYLCYKMEQRNGPVFSLPLKEIQDSLDEDQRAIFKGYGKGRKNKYLATLDEAGDIGLPEMELPNSDVPAVNTPVANGRVDSGFVSAPSSDLGYKMDVMLETLVGESRQTQVLLQKLIGALTTDSEPVLSPAPVKTKTARLSKKKSAPPPIAEKTIEEAVQL